jgi:hypothetical protein
VRAVRWLPPRLYASGRAPQLQPDSKSRQGRYAGATEPGTCLRTPGDIVRGYRNAAVALTVICPRRVGTARPGFAPFRKRPEGLEARSLRSLGLSGVGSAGRKGDPTARAPYFAKCLFVDAIILELVIQVLLHVHRKPPAH